MLSIHEEKALVFRISKLERLKSEEAELLAAQQQRRALDRQLHLQVLAEKFKLRKEELKAELQDLVDQLVEECDRKSPEGHGEFYFSKAWIEKYIIRPELALGSFDDETLIQVCPRLDRRMSGRPPKQRRSKLWPSEVKVRCQKERSNRRKELEMEM